MAPRPLPRLSNFVPTFCCWIWRCRACPDWKPCGNWPRNTPKLRVILLTAAVENRQMVEALQIGARGVVMKEAATQILLQAIRTVMAGQYWVGREPVADLAQYLSAHAAGQQNAKAKSYGFTRREIEILSTIVSGLSNKEIAQKFSLSEDTVKHHLTNIFDKLGVSSRLELALFAINNRLIEAV